MNEMPLISVVILSWNRREDLRFSLTQVFQLDYSPYEVIVVDNNSTDGTCEMVRNEFPDVHLIQLEKNIGIAGWNEGFEVAKGDYILVLDDDSYPEPHLLRLGIKTIETNHQIGIVAYQIFNQNSNSFQTEKYREGLVLTFIGCGALIRSNVLNRVGGFEPLLFLYGHEEEFSMRVLDAGYQILFMRDANIYHIASSLHRTRNIVHLIDTRRQFYNLRNTLIILLLHFPFRKILFRIIRITCGRIVYGIKYGCLRTILHAVSSFIKSSPEIISRRNILKVATQRQYGYGKLFGGFYYSDGINQVSKPAIFEKIELYQS